MIDDDEWFLWEGLKRSSYGRINRSRNRVASEYEKQVVSLFQDLFDNRRCVCVVYNNSKFI
jgi:hypothetical protein